MEILQEMVGKPAEAFEVWPENDVSLGVFLRCTTQFRYRKNGEHAQIAGIDYTSLESLLRIYKIRNKAEIFEDIRAMELAILSKINEEN